MEQRVAVLGAGIMGCSLALLLARRGRRVTLVDRAAAPFAGASRWNEGKVHLGYLYAGDRSMDTARRLLPGGLAFRPRTEELIGCSLDEQVTPADDVYLVHRSSVADPQATGRYFEAVSALVRSHAESAGYLVDASRASVRSLSPRELEALADPEHVVAGYRVPERSVQTLWLADRFVEAVRAEPRIELALSTRVRGVRPAGPSVHGAWTVDADPPLASSYDLVANALWEGRPQVDASAGVHPEAPWSHRYRLALFVRTERAVDLPSAVVCTGPFGDVKNYNGRDLYVSWYPAGLVAEGDGLAPPSRPHLDRSRRRALAAATWTELGSLLPPVRALEGAARREVIAGGWVYAEGRGSLADPAATLHRRDRFGVRRLGGYLSIDTGKLSTAPWLAREVADRITGVRA